MKEKATIYDFIKYTRYALRSENGTHICDSCPVGLCDMKEYDTKCGRVCGCMSMLARDIDKANEIILNWCKEHPVKTRQDKFLEMFPNVSMNNGIIDICPKTVDKYAEGDCNGECCDECRKSYWLSEVEE